MAVENSSACLTVVTYDLCGERKALLCGSTALNHLSSLSQRQTPALKLLKQILKAFKFLIVYGWLIRAKA
jgi:hypothetical protein